MLLVRSLATMFPGLSQLRPGSRFPLLEDVKVPRTLERLSLDVTTLWDKLEYSQPLDDWVRGSCAHGF